MDRMEYNSGSNPESNLEKEYDYPLKCTTGSPILLLINIRHILCFLSVLKPVGNSKKYILSFTCKCSDLIYAHATDTSCTTSTCTVIP